MLHRIVPVSLFSLTLFLVPLFPDAKLNRLKLMVFGAGLILAGLSWALLKARESKWIFYRTPLDPFILLYVFSALFYYGFSQNSSIAFNEFQRMIFSVGAFFIAVQIGINSRKMAIYAWIISLSLVSIYAIFQKFGGIGSFVVSQTDRVSGTFGNPIFFAAFLIISIPLIPACYTETKNRLGRIFLSLAFLAALPALFYTKTRAAFLSVPPAFLLFYLFYDRGQNWKWTHWLWKYKTKLIILLAVGTALHFTCYRLSSKYVQRMERITMTIQDARLVSTQQTHTLIWKDVLTMWRAHPWFGTGYGTFHIEFPQYASEELKKVFPQSRTIINDAHNEYLQILAETGLIGFMIFMAVIVRFYWVTLLSAVPQSFGLLAGITALFIQNVFSVDMRFIVSSVYLFLAMGLAVSFFAVPVTVQWQRGRLGTVLKSAWCLAFILISGLIGIRWNPQSLFIFGIYRIAQNPNGAWEWQKTPALGPGLFPALVRPYLSQKIVAQTPDFFDLKLLNSAQTISDLEKLTQQFPDQWKYWEKLGYVLAKEIQKTDNAGKKIIDVILAGKAIQSYQKAHELNPQAPGPSNNLGNIYYTLNQQSQAMGWWQKTIEENPDTLDARLNLGLAYYNAGKIKEAALQFQEVLKRDPGNERAIVMLKRMVE